jgi:hypothetical protein
MKYYLQSIWHCVFLIAYAELVVRGFFAGGNENSDNQYGYQKAENAELFHFE